MALNIKDPESTRLARELARETGESMTAAVRVALRERLDRVRGARGRRAALDRILQAAWSLPRLDARAPDEIIGYDEHGLPR